MGNVLSDDKRQQVLALGRLGWSLRRIEKATDVRRETASAYLKAAGVRVRGRGRPPSARRKPATTDGVSTDSEPKPRGCPRTLGRQNRPFPVSTDSEPVEAHPGAVRPAPARVSPSGK